MAESLGNNAKWEGLLKTSDTEQINAIERPITDGTGNESALSLSLAKVWVKLLNIKNIVTSTSINSVLVIDSNGDVKKRVLNSSVFNQSLQNRFIAKSSGVQASPVPFNPEGSASGDSILLGDGLSLNGSNSGIIVDGLGKVVEVQFKGAVEFVETNAAGTLQIKNEGVTLRVVELSNPTGIGNAESIVNLTDVFTTSTVDDEITLEYSSTSGTINIKDNSILDVNILN